MEKITQHWKPQLVDKDPNFKFLIVDNWYTPEEEQAVWSELDFYNHQQKIQRAEDTIVARGPNEEPLSTAYRFYMTDYYTKVGYKKSPIANFMYKQKTPEFGDLLESILPYSRMFFCTNRDSTLISYYEENDHYDSHCDTFMWTNLIWFVREPRKFDGGDFDFPESNIQVKLKHNRAIFFPSCYLHRVSPVKFHTPIEKKGEGRFTITHFYYWEAPTEPVDYD